MKCYICLFNLKILFIHQGQVLRANCQLRWQSGKRTVWGLPSKFLLASSQVFTITFAKTTARCFVWCWLSKEKSENMWSAGYKSIPTRILGKKGEHFYRPERSNSWRNNVNGLRIIGTWETCKWNTSSLSALVGPLSSVSVLTLTENLTPFPSIIMNSTSLLGFIAFRYVYKYRLLLFVWENWRS